MYFFSGGVHATEGSKQFIKSTNPEEIQLGEDADEEMEEGGEDEGEEEEEEPEVGLEKQAVPSEVFGSLANDND